MTEWIFAALLLVAQGSFCETNCTVRVGSPFIAFTETEATATGYRVLVNGVPRTDAIASVANGFIEFTFPKGLSTPGKYTMVIEIFLPAGVTATDPGVLSVVRRQVKFKE